MSLYTLLSEVHRDWYSKTGSAKRLINVDAKLIEKARRTPLGQRMLARWLLADAPNLLAPHPAGLSNVITLWSQERINHLVRDLGILAFAPAIRAEIGREPVRILKKALGNSYLLALDKTIWDGNVSRSELAEMRAELNAVLVASDSEDHGLYQVFEKQGRSEFLRWGKTHKQQLAEWMQLQRAKEQSVTTYLPDHAVLIVFGHHESRVKK